MNFSENRDFVLVLVLVLIKDDLFIKRMLTQKASVYPGFFLKCSLFFVLIKERLTVKRMLATWLPCTWASIP